MTYTYTFSYWLFFFYFYCFAGWLWECLYVSVLQAKWVNRGFMHGPFLPLYGSGAVVVLVSTMPFRDNTLAVYLAGMCAATLMEYVTGVVMEKIFGVRYWDYSDKPLNLNGHICITASLMWGVFSVVLMQYAHSVVESVVFLININIIEVVTFLLTAYIAVDFAASIREALDLKEMLLSLEESNPDFRRMQRHIDVITTFYGTEIKERSEAGLKILNKTLMSGKEKAEYISSLKKTREFKEVRRMSGLLKRNPEAMSVTHSEAFEKLKSLTSIVKPDKEQK